MGKNISLLLAKLFVAFIFLVVLNISITQESFAQTCTPWKNTASSLPSCSSPLFQLNCNGSGNKTGTQCCTSNQVAGGPYDYCQGGIANPPAPQQKFRCCFSVPTPTPTPTPTPVPCVAGGGVCIGTYPCNPGKVPSALSCGGSKVCCVAPTPTPTPAPTSTPTPTPAPTPVPCSSYGTCALCIADLSCGWGVNGGVSSCRNWTAACPASYTGWYWQTCSTNECTVPTSTPQQFDKTHNTRVQFILDGE